MTTTTRTTTSPLASLLLVIGGLALIVGVVLGMHSNPTGAIGATCGTTFHFDPNYGCAATGNSSLAWALTIAGGIALIGGIAAIATRKAADKDDARQAEYDRRVREQAELDAS